MTCNEYRERMPRDIDRLASDETSETRRHLAHCPECQRYYDEEVHMVALIAASVRPLRMREDLTGKIIARLPEAEEMDDLPTPGARILWWGAGLAAAALLVVGLFAIPMGTERPSRDVESVLADLRQLSRDIIHYATTTEIPDVQPFRDRLAVLRSRVDAIDRDTPNDHWVSAARKTCTLLEILTDPVTREWISRHRLEFTVEELDVLNQVIFDRASPSPREIAELYDRWFDSYVLSAPAARSPTGRVDVPLRVTDGEFRRVEIGMSYPDVKAVLEEVNASEALLDMIDTDPEKGTEHYAFGLVDGKCLIVDVARADNRVSALTICADMDRPKSERIWKDVKVVMIMPLTPDQRKTLDKLNSWDKEELDVAERPDAHPGRKASGETGGWILTYKKELRKLGLDARWNAVRRQYEVTKIKEILLDLSTPEKAWEAFAEALKSGDEERIKAVTTEKGWNSLMGQPVETVVIRGTVSTEKRRKPLGDEPNGYVIEPWSVKEETATATAWREPKVPGGFVTIELKKTPEGWKLDDLAPGE